MYAVRQPPRWGTTADGGYDECGNEQRYEDEMSAVVNPMVMGLGTTELLIILGVLILLFGAKKLPELARGSGRALRIFKSETKGLMDDDDDGKAKTDEQREIDARNRAAESTAHDVRAQDGTTQDGSDTEIPVQQRHPDTDR